MSIVCLWVLSIYECASLNASVYNEGEESYRGLTDFPKTPNLLIIDEETKLQADVLAITLFGSSFKGMFINLDPLELLIFS